MVFPANHGQIQGRVTTEEIAAVAQFKRCMEIENFTQANTFRNLDESWSLFKKGKIGLQLWEGIIQEGRKQYHGAALLFKGPGR